MRPLLLVLPMVVFCFCASSPGAAGSARSDLEALIRTSGSHRSAGTEGAAKALAWLRAEAAKLKGWELEEQRFEPDIDFAIKSYRDDFKRLVADRLAPADPEHQKWKRFTENAVAYLETLRGKAGVNLILRKAGGNAARMGEPVVIGAHYDTITQDLGSLRVTPEAPAPGADDNGAAVAVLLGVARELKSLSPTGRLELVFFDYEEEFFLGSKAYAERLQKAGAKARFVNLEMIGWDKPYEGRVKLYARSAGKPGGDADFELAKKIAPFFTKAGLAPQILRNNFDRSDNWSFWNFFHTAVTVSQDWEHCFNHEHYHTAKDTPETLDWRFVGRIGGAVTAAARALAR